MDNKTIKIGKTETKRIFGDYILADISRELGDFAGTGETPSPGRLRGIAIDLEYVADLLEQIERDK